ncbi:unnamed protein product, partial [Brenthis ino]
MGCTAKVTMPLLSTLAALVIIVHTAEENYELSYRETLPRIVDVEPHSYGQLWSAVEVEPAIMHNTQQNQDGWSDASPDQPMRRRRRKRKRRPQLSPQNELQIQDTQIFQNEPHVQQDTVEMTRRRRKKVNYHDTGELNLPGQLTEDIPNKPLRRRGHRRKRPLVEHRPELNEFSGNRPDTKVNNEHTETQSTNVFENKNVNNEERIIVEPEIQEDHENENFEEKITQVNIVDNKSEQEKVEYESYLPKDKSLSEFSSELLRTTQSSNIHMLKTKPKIFDKTISVTNDVNESQEKELLDPVTLKALLKKSNGKSLSEILQQNNLSLSDLLHGKAKALSILQTTDLSDTKDTKQTELENKFLKVTIAPIDNVQSIVTDEKNEDASIITEVKHEHDNKENADVDDCSTTETNLDNKENTSEKTNSIKEDLKNSAITDNKIKDNLRRRFPVGARRRLRMRPTTNSTNKVQFNRDLIMSTSLKYKNNRNMSKSKEWKEVVATMLRRRPTFKEVNIEPKSDSTKITTVIVAPEETTTEEIFETTTDPYSLLTNTETTIYTDNTETLNTADSRISNIIPEIPSPTDTTIEDDGITEKVPLYEKTNISPVLKPLVNSSELRRHAYNNRLKRKRLKQKVVSTEEHEIKDIFGDTNFVSASEFIEKVQTKATIPDSEEYTTLEDFMTTEPVQNAQTTPIRSTKTSIKTTTTTISTTESAPDSTEDSAKYEIEEILNDSMTSERLSKILKERNMTLSELVEHRERGSSHVHLADIFHNASKEPNPPEPFLSKSLIEPISREIYPLRALLDANLHDPKTTTYDANSVLTNNLDIPVVMDFGNNVNENGENMGIISLFNNFSKINSEMQNNKENKHEYDKIYSNNLNKNEKGREGRTLSSEKDAMTLNDLIKFMQKNNQKGNINVDTLKTESSPTYENLKNIKLEDIDNDGLIVLEDLQNLKNFDSRPSSDELLDIKLYKNNETPAKTPIESSLNSTTKSVTVATVTIIGLALTLFLLTYIVLKWKQNSKSYHNKHSKEDKCVPTPIFENRKTHKRNSSTRSKSPMISSNIYTIDSLDTHTGNESPEYMWDTLRKPFQ